MIMSNDDIKPLNEDREAGVGRSILLSDQPNPKKAKWDLTDMLSDEVLLDLLLKFDPDAATLARLTAVNKRFRSLLQDDKVLRSVTSKKLKKHRNDGGILADGWSWRVLGFYEAAHEAGIFEENRIGFDFASTDIDDDDGEASMIPGSMRRVDALARILQKFEDTNLIVDAHCGTAAPASIAPAFSRARGEAVRVEVLHSSYVTDMGDVAGRITVKGWGRRVTQRVVVSSHKFRDIAREGRGWVEVYLKMGDINFPKRPSFYDGVQEIADSLGEGEEPIMIPWD